MKRLVAGCGVVNMGSASDAAETRLENLRVLVEMFAAIQAKRPQDPIFYE